MNKRTLRQQEIVDITRQIIITKGMEKLTVREIAKQLKITDGALYRHFESKKAILSLLIDDIEQTLLATLSEAAKKSSTPLQKLESIFYSHLSYAEQRRGVSFIVINKTLNAKDKTLQQKMLGVINKYLNVIKGILNDGIKSKIFRAGINLEAAGIIFFGMVQSVVTVTGLKGHGSSRDKDLLDEMFDLYMRSIVATKSAQY